MHCASDFLSLSTCLPWIPNLYHLLDWTYTPPAGLRLHGLLAVVMGGCLYADIKVEELNNCAPLFQVKAGGMQ